MLPLTLALAAMYDAGDTDIGDVCQRAPVCDTDSDRWSVYPPCVAGRIESCRGSRALSGQHLMAPRIWRLRAASPRNRSLRSSVGGAARFSRPLLIYARESCPPTAPKHWLSFTARQYQGHSRGVCIHGTYDCVTYDLCAHLLWVLGPVPDGRC